MTPEIAEWRATEVAAQQLATELHRAAAEDLASAPDLWPAIETDGLVRDLLSVRARSRVPSIHLSSAAGRLAVVAVLVEMGERRGSSALAWQNQSLGSAARALHAWTPSLCAADLEGLAGDLPGLARARRALATLDDADIGRLAGRVLESAISCYWLFGSERREPERVWHPWMAKQQGAFFTPQFIAQYMAREALRRGSAPVLDPAVGAGALLLEVFLRLKSDLGSDEALEALYGVDIDAGMCALAALTLNFLADRWIDGRPALLDSQIIVGDALLARRDGDPSWRTWFPAVLRQGGFGAVVMNPPYGQLKVNQSTLPARHGDGDEARSIRQKALEDARGRASATAEALRQHPDYRVAHGGVPDLPRFFVERALSLLRDSGCLTCIVPSTFLADHRSRTFRRHLLDEHSLKELNLIPEDARLFLGVNQPTCVLVVEAGTGATSVRVRRRVVSTSDLRKRTDVTISHRLIATVDPDERRIPNVGAADLEILSQMHQHPRLGDTDWIVNLRGELDLTIDAEYISSRATGFRLVRGDQIERYRDDLPSDKAGWVYSAFLKDRVSARKAMFLDQSRIVLRQCSYLKKAHRISATVVDPHVVVANSCNFLAIRGHATGGLGEREALMFLLGVINSRLLDWRFRTTSSTNHVGNYELDALPIPAPDGQPEVAALIAASERLLQVPSDTEAEEALESAVQALYGLPSEPPT